MYAGGQAVEQSEKKKDYSSRKWNILLRYLLGLWTAYTAIPYYMSVCLNETKEFTFKRILPKWM